MPQIQVEIVERGHVQTALASIATSLPGAANFGRTLALAAHVSAAVLVMTHGILGLEQQPTRTARFGSAFPFRAPVPGSDSIEV
jgi:hypothetical protein